MESEIEELILFLHDQRGTKDNLNLPVIICSRILQLLLKVNKKVEVLEKVQVNSTSRHSNEAYDD